MCKCVNIEIGSYENQICISPPADTKMYAGMSDKSKPICLDVCVAEEVQYLWFIGIVTTGCCCGHNMVSPFIGVTDEDIPRMKEMGYKVAYNDCRPNDEDSFIPKTNL